MLVWWVEYHEHKTKAFYRHHWPVFQPRNVCHSKYIPAIIWQHNQIQHVKIHALEQERIYHFTKRCLDPLSARLSSTMHTKIFIFHCSWKCELIASPRLYMLHALLLPDHNQNHYFFSFYKWKLRRFDLWINPPQRGMECHWARCPLANQI